MLPLTRKDTIAFTLKRDNAPTYQIGVPTIAGRANFRRKIEEEGASFITDADLLDILREGIKEILTDTQQAEALAAIDSFEVAKIAGDVPPALDSQVKDLERHIRTAYAPYAEAVAERGYYLAIMPIVATQCFLRGIENGVIFRAKAGVITEDCLESIPDEDVVAVGWQAVSLFTPAENQIKNSESPLQSTANPEILTAVE